MIATALLEQLEPPITDQAETVDDVWTLFLWIGFGVLAMVVVLVVWIMFRYRRRSDDLPPQKHYNIPMEIAYTVIPLFVVAGLFALTVVTIQAIDGTDDDPDLIVHVTAYQWSWEFEYPDSGVTIVDDSDVSDPELVLPASSTIRFDLESLDVVHSFWLTAFRFKRDMIPGSPTSFRVDMGDTVGWFPNAGVCAEFCGLDHAYMRFSVRLLEPAEFDAWLDDQRAAQDVPTSGSEEAAP
ncbi:MAG: cytochrome c oxidase subunit II [Ilumatobacteraceae bacterium]